TAESEIRGITVGLLRLSVGVENAEDLERDFEQALKKITPAQVRS
ncbi:PLP-dependent transferase, partial [Bacillus sp. RHFS18]|nr:PLP-dependent transferase [Bacillus sp. RHFS18]